MSKLSTLFCFGRVTFRSSFSGLRKHEHTYKRNLKDRLGKMRFLNAKTNRDAQKKEREVNRARIVRLRAWERAPSASPAAAIQYSCPSAAISNERNRGHPLSSPPDAASSFPASAGDGGSRCAFALGPDEPAQSDLPARAEEGDAASDLSPTGSAVRTRPCVFASHAPLGDAVRPAKRARLDTPEESAHGVAASLALAAVEGGSDPVPPARRAPPQRLPSRARTACILRRTSPKPPSVAGDGDGVADPHPPPLCASAAPHP